MALPFSRAEQKAILISWRIKILFNYKEIVGHLKVAV